MKNKCSKILAIIFLSFITLSSPTLASANHSWGNYHWARTANPYALKLGSSVSPAWLPYLNTTSNDWSISSILDTSIVNGSTNIKNCRATSGKVEVCNSRYGNNGWLGIAQIWTNGNHIVQGITKMNDTYFNTSTYNTSAWRNMVMCQEVGHTLGLDHQDEIFDNPNLGTCMDYTNNPSSNQHPNQHDYDQLEIIYTHLDSFTSLTQTTLLRKGMSDNFDNPSNWGQQIKKGNKTAVFEKNLGFEAKVFTFVVYAE